MSFLARIVIGLIAGWLAGQVMEGGGYGVLTDIFLDILGGYSVAGSSACERSAGRPHDRIDHCCIRWGSDPPLDYPLA